jgi:hypothetical protein
MQMEKCWLCQFTHTSDAKTISSFITDNVGSISHFCIAVQVAEDLQDRYPDAEGTSVEAVVKHIESHTLHPTCRIATMLRNLLKLSDDLQTVLKQDETADAKTIDTYLKVQSQILQIYRLNETNKMLFSEKTI